MPSFGSITMKRACSISARQTSNDSSCIRIIDQAHPSQSKLNREWARIRGSRLSSRSRGINCRRRCGSHYRTSQCKDRTGQTHSPPRSQADERHRRSGNCRSSKRRATRRLCQKILQGDGSDAAAEDVGDWRNALHFCLGAGSGHNSGMIVRSSIHE
jgi:hypothetical protein